MDDSPAGSIILFFIFMLLGGYFSGAEISLASVNKIHMISRSGQGIKKADKVLYILDRFDEALSVLLIGNNIVIVGCASLSVVVATKIWGEKSVSLATVVTALITFIFAEMIPKCFARSCNESFAEAISGSLIILMKIFKPFSALLTAISTGVTKLFKVREEETPTVTEDELQTLVENISEEDGFDENTGELVKSALEFTKSTAKDVMIPWDNVQTIKSSMKTPEILETIKSSVHSRIPVTDRKGKVKGILQIRAFLKAYIKKGQNVILASVTDYPYFVSADISLDDLIVNMSNHRRNLAIVKDENGNPLGIVTVEDIMEELVGEIYDEDDIGGDGNE